MIQFNLLPDVKLEYIKAQRNKHLVIMISILLAAVFVAITIVLFVGVNMVQKKHLSNLDEHINEMSDQLKNEGDINKILTVQNQLQNLDSLHDTKPAAARLGSYLSQITPANVAISELSVNFTENTMKFEGKATALKDVNEFIDTMKFTTYKVESIDGEEISDEAKNAFTNVVLASFDRTDKDDAMPATYQITLSFDPAIFDIKIRPSFVIKDQITTRSVTERPTPLFQQQPEEEE